MTIEKKVHLSFERAFFQGTQKDKDCYDRKMLYKYAEKRYVNCAENAFP